MIRILKAGSLATLQDLGRPGLAHLAISPSGAADRNSLLRANRLVGNPDRAAVLELTLLGARLRFERDVRFAFAGAAMPATLDGEPISLVAALSARAGQELAIGAARRGVRGYLAIEGGFDALPVLGSRSTDLLSNLGPPIVRDGDVLPVGSLYGVEGEPPPPTPLEDEAAVRLWPGPREDWFTAEAVATLRSACWRLTPQSNRIGIRLEGPMLERAITRELPSEGLVTGAVQVPANGQPLVFLADHPTTGGYPVIGVVHVDDVSKLGQLRPGNGLRFT